MVVHRERKNQRSGYVRRRELSPENAQSQVFWPLPKCFCLNREEDRNQYDQCLVSQVAHLKNGQSPHNFRSGTAHKNHIGFYPWN